MENKVSSLYKDMAALFGAENVKVLADPESVLGITMLTVERETISAMRETEMELFKSIIFKAKTVYVFLKGKKIRFTVSV